MSEETKKQLQLYVDAVKLDMLELLQKPALNVFEFRRMAELCDILIPLCNSAAGGTIMPNVITQALWESEDVAPTLHKALGGHVFDAETLLKEKYEAMARDHAKLRQQLAMAKLAERDHSRNALLMAGQIEDLQLEQTALAAERRMLMERGEALDRRELALTAGTEEKKLPSDGTMIEAEVEETESETQLEEQSEAPT